MTQAFTQKGARVCISRSGDLRASYTDQATTCQLHYLILEKGTVDQAVAKTMKRVGLNPACRSLLTYYPQQAGEQTLENTDQRG